MKTEEDLQEYACDHGVVGYCRACEDERGCNHTFVEVEKDDKIHILRCIDCGKLEVEKDEIKNI